MVGLLVLLAVAVVGGSYAWAHRHGQPGGPGVGGRPGLSGPAFPDLDRWAAAGLLAPEQVSAIREYEGAHEPSVRRISLAQEAIGYVGAVLVLAGGGAALGQVWSDIHPWVRVVIFAGAAGLGILGGFVVSRQEEPALRRLTSVLWFLSTAAWAVAVGLAVGGVWHQPPEVVIVTTGGAVSLLALGLWLIRRTALQQIAVLAGVMATLLGGLTVLPGEAPIWAYALIVWAIGTAWASLGWRDVMQPQWASLPLGAVVALVAPSIAASQYGWAFLLALATAASLLALAVRMRFPPFLALGAVGLFAYLTWAVVKYFGSSLGVPLALTVAGVVILAGALGASRLLRTIRRSGGGPLVGQA